MITFESEYKNFQQRLFSFENFAFLGLFIFYSFLVFSLKLLFYYTIIIELTLFMVFAIIIINRTKSKINLISFDENSIILNGETFNKQWKKVLNLKETNIAIKCISSRQGLRGVIFYIRLKNKKDTYTINSFSDEKIIEIFNEFKNLKGEKIIIDERLDILRMQEKIEKCQ